MIKSYRAFGACITWVILFGNFANTCHYATLLSDRFCGGIAATTIDYLNSFHVLTNILVGLTFTAPFLKPGNKLRRFFEIQAVRAAIALYATVGVIFYTVFMTNFVTSIYNERGVLDIFAHSVLPTLVIPLLYIFDWLFFAPKDKMSYKYIPYWFIFPFTYGVYTIICYKFTGAYPLTFLKLTNQRIELLFVITLASAAFYAIGGAVFIALGRWLGRHSNAANALD